MRIIAGRYRGRVLKTLRGPALRPTSDRLRETLFNVLGAAVEGAVFVDGYAGIGAVGLEALSRGARQVWMIEENAAACRVIRANLAALQVNQGEELQLLETSMQKGFRLLEQRGVEAAFCFLDPPYADRRAYSECLRWLDKTSLMAPQGVVILEHSRKDVLEDSVGGWSRVRLLEQSSSALSFYRLANPSRACPALVEGTVMKRPRNIGPGKHLDKKK